MDYNKRSGFGVPSKTDIVVLSTDNENYAVIYMCKEKRFGKNDWVWILSREPELSEELIEEAKQTIAEKYEKFDFDRLVTVT